MSDALLTSWNACRQALNAASRGHEVALVAVGKTRPTDDIRALAALGQNNFGENYVQEALPKIAACTDLGLTWHFIGPLQSNKARDVARHFDWVQTVDRQKLVPLLADHRPANTLPLNVLVQVNIGDEAGKSGCTPNEIAALADAIAAQPRLRLRGLMAIPQPHPNLEHRRDAFKAMQVLFDELQSRHPGVDTLSMGMSDDFPLAIECGATMVRIGSALFGPRR